MAENALQHHPISGLAGPDEQDITLVEHNFAALMSFSDALAERFYQRLFAEYPAIMPLFKSVTIEGQHKKLLASMVLLIQHLRDSEMIEDYLQGLGVRHQQYGVEQSHYEMFIENWLSVVAEFSEQEWDDTLLQAWRNVLQYVAELMQTPAGQVAQPVTVYQTDQAPAAEYVLTSLAVEQTATPMIIIDLNLVVSYLNVAAETLLKQYQDSLKKMFPDLNIERLKGISLQHFAEAVPFPIEWLSDFEQLPRSIDLRNDFLDVRLTISVLYKNDKPEGFLLECYPHSATGSGLSLSSTPNETAPLAQNILPALEKTLYQVQLQNSHLTAMLQEIDDAVFETSLLALNCTVEAAKLGDDARQLRDFSMEIRVLNQQLSQLLQPLKIQSGQQQQQLNKSIELSQQLEKDLTHNHIGWENRSRHSIEQISQQLSEQTNALTQLIKVITKNTEL
ncbi:globin domain-containing protein [Methylophaga sp.]|uniref:globin family protein n=1 Tax=Methylophaga sp. TaxID=2024840 RepID=UPI003F71B3A4